MSRPPYWDRACRELAERDTVLADLITAHRADMLSGSGDAFTTLVNAIVGQQISVAAAAGIWGRLTSVYPELTPESLVDAPIEKLREIGLSGRKAEYIRGIATARLYGWDKFDAISEQRERLAKHAERWRPWRTVATWFIWRDLDRFLVTNGPAGGLNERCGVRLTDDPAKPIPRRAPGLFDRDRLTTLEPPGYRTAHDSPRLVRAGAQPFAHRVDRRNLQPTISPSPQTVP